MEPQTFNVGDCVRVVFKDDREKVDFKAYLNNDISSGLEHFIAPILDSRVLYVNQVRHPYLDHLSERYRHYHCPGLVGVSLSLEHVYRHLVYPYIFYVPEEMLQHASLVTLTRRLTVRPE